MSVAETLFGLALLSIFFIFLGVVLMGRDSGALRSALVIVALMWAGGGGMLLLLHLFPGMR